MKFFWWNITITRKLKKVKRRKYRKKVKTVKTVKRKPSLKYTQKKSLSYKMFRKKWADQTKAERCEYNAFLRAHKDQPKLEAFLAEKAQAKATAVDSLLKKRKKRKNPWDAYTPEQKKERLEALRLARAKRLLINDARKKGWKVDNAHDVKTNVEGAK